MNAAEKPSLFLPRIARYLDLVDEIDRLDLGWSAAFVLTDRATLDTIDAPERAHPGRDKTTNYVRTLLTQDGRLVDFQTSDPPVSEVAL